MSAERMKLFFSSPNGDNWFLCHDDASGRAFVRHKANPSSGGHETDSDVDDFLNRGPRNPEHEALLRLMAEGAVAAPKATQPRRSSKTRKKPTR
jgi:hypothetical protein